MNSNTSPSVTHEPPSITRRGALTLIGLAGTSILAACSDPTEPSTSGVTTSGSSPDPGTVITNDSSSAGIDTPTPSETSGPFPSDGSNDDGSGRIADVLHDPRSIRRDIRSDLDGTNIQIGLPLRLRTRVVSKSVPLAGAAVYVWHCNVDGQYSGYDSRMLGGEFADRSFLRGVQITDADGWVEFDTILPGRYRGRAFHIHFEVFANESLGSRLLTSQMAMDDDLIDSLYAQADGYETALDSDTDNSQDNVFADGVNHQLLTVTGDVTTGLSAEFIAYV